MAEQAESKELAKAEKDKDFEVITPEEQKAGEERYQKEVKELLEEESTLTRKTLRHYWRRGRFVEDLSANPKLYGGKTLLHLSRDLKVPSQTLGKWHRFYLKYKNEAELAELCATGLSWRDVSNLLVLEDDRVREALIQKCVAGELTSNELQAKIAEENDRARKEARKAAKDFKLKKAKTTKDGDITRRQAQSLISTVRNTSKLMKNAGSAIEDFREAYDEFQKLGESKYKSELQAALQDAFKDFGQLKKRVDWIIEYRDKVLAKRRASEAAAKKD